MKMLHIDPELRQVANTARQELEIRRLRVQLKRCQQGIPRHPAWEKSWDDYISHAVTQAVADYINKKNAQPPQQNNRPVAAVPQQPATQLAQPQNTAVASYNRF